MKTVKEVSQITGVSIRTLRYYDEIGLLPPTTITEAGYRLYDQRALEKLQEILFFKELELPLNEIRDMMNRPDYNKQQALATQKHLLECKRNRLNGIIELISDVMKGVNTMSFGAFSKEEVEQIAEHTLHHMNPEALAEQIEQFGGEEAYKEYLSKGFENEKAVAELIKWYGSKEKTLQAVLGTSTAPEPTVSAADTELIYRQFAQAKESNSTVLATDAVEKLADNYKAMFHLDNARNILLDLAKEYAKEEGLATATDTQYGEGVSAFIANTIQHYYGAI